MDEYIRKCSYCLDSVSIFESVTEYGKHYHESCYIQKTQKEIYGYKKKWIDKKLTRGDLDDLVEKFNLVQKLMTERTEFKGFVPIDEFKKDTPHRTEKTMLYLGNGIVAKDECGNPVMIESKFPSVSFTTLKFRPEVKRTKTKYVPKLITVQDIPRLMESL